MIQIEDKRPFCYCGHKENYVGQRCWACPENKRFAMQNVDQPMVFEDLDYKAILIDESGSGNVLAFKLINLSDNTIVSSGRISNTETIYFNESPAASFQDLTAYWRFGAAIQRIINYSLKFFKNEKL